MISWWTNRFGHRWKQYLYKKSSVCDKWGGAFQKHLTIFRPRLTLITQLVKSLLLSECCLTFKSNFLTDCHEAEAVETPPMNNRKNDNHQDRFLLLMMTYLLTFPLCFAATPFRLRTKSLWWPKYAGELLSEVFLKANVLTANTLEEVEVALLWGGNAAHRWGTVLFFIFFVPCSACTAATVWFS